jgi:hypothetical protein
MAPSNTEQSGNNGGVLSIYMTFMSRYFSPLGHVLCGASPGDYFTLQGEMLYLPPGPATQL